MLPASNPVAKWIETFIEYSLNILLMRKSCWQLFWQLGSLRENFAATKMIRHEEVINIFRRSTKVADPYDFVFLCVWTSSCQKLKCFRWQRKAYWHSDHSNFACQKDPGFISVWSSSVLEFKSLSMRCAFLPSTNMVSLFAVVIKFRCNP